MRTVQFELSLARDGIADAAGRIVELEDDKADGRIELVARVDIERNRLRLCRHRVRRDRDAWRRLMGAAKWLTSLDRQRVGHGGQPQECRAGLTQHMVLPTKS